MKLTFLVILLTFLVSCGSDKDAYTTESERVDDMPRTGKLDCGYSRGFMICSNETITFKVHNGKATYKIRVD